VIRRLAHFLAYASYWPESWKPRVEQLLYFCLWFEIVGAAAILFIQLFFAKAA